MANMYIFKMCNHIRNQMKCSHLVLEVFSGKVCFIVVPPLVCTFGYEFGFLGKNPSSATY